MNNTKKLISILLLSVAGLFFGTNSSLSQPSNDQLFEKALYFEDATGDLQQAIEIYQQILKDNPENRNVGARALLHMGICYEKLGLRQARGTYQDVIKKYPDQQGEVDMATERLNRLNQFAADINKKAEQHFKNGNELMKLWEYEPAINEYEKAIKLDPGTLLAQNARYCIGQCWFKSGQYDSALATFEKLIKDFPESNIAPVTELMISQVKYAVENQEIPKLSINEADDNTILDPETGITYTKIKAFTGKSDVITYTNDLNLSPNGKYLLSGNKVVPMDGTASFELIEYHSTGIEATGGTWSPDGTQAAFFSGDALCVVPVSPGTGHTSGPIKKILNEKLKYQSAPDWSPDGKKLTYYGPNGKLWTIKANGDDLTQITKSDTREVGPVWSPDGKNIAFGTAINYSLCLYDIEKETSTELSRYGFRCFPMWSPDGNWLTMNWGNLHFYNLAEKSKFEFKPLKEAGSFFSWIPGSMKMLFFRTSYHYDSGLRIASSAGGLSCEPVPLLTNWGTAAWSGNSKLMAVQGEDENGNINYRIVPLTGGKSFLINLDNLIDGKPFPYTISPGLDKLLFFVDGDYEKEDVFIVPVSAEEARITGPAVKIFEGNNMQGPVSFSPDGKKVALINEGNIWIAYTNGDDPVRVPNATEKMGFVRWTPDGKTLLVETPSGWALLKNPETEGNIVPLLDDSSSTKYRHWSIDFSPDIAHIALLSDKQIKIISLDGSGSSRVLDLKELQLSGSHSLKWSPDGKNLAFMGMKETDDRDSFPDGKWQIFNIPANGGQPIRVAPDDNDYKFGLSWSPDGKWIAYSPQVPVKVRPESTLWEADFEEILEKSGK